MEFQIILRFKLTNTELNNIVNFLVDTVDALIKKNPVAKISYNLNP